MKHLIHKKHLPHLRKRAYLEIIGLFLLIGFSYSQRGVIQEALTTVSRVEALWFLILLASYWVVLPLTVFSYRLISPKPRRLKLFNTTLAHLAGAGPGRIIPGGIGNLSISALHLKKTGLSIEQSIAVVATNNLIGVGTNLVLLIGVMIIRPELVEQLTGSISSQQLLVGGGIIVALIVLLQWLWHARSTHREIVKTLREWRQILNKFCSQPSKVFKVLLISLSVAIIHALLVDFSAFALGINLGFTNALIALSFGVALGGVFPTPGGVGGVEAGIAAALLVLGYDGATATSIAVLYRVAIYWQPLIPGTIAYLYLRERKLV